MAINLKLETFGAQFNAFVDFAKENAANGDTLACIGGDYTQFDESAPDAVMKRQLGEDEAGAAKLGPFRFGEGVKVNVSCTAVLNGGLLMVEQEF